MIFKTIGKIIEFVSGVFTGALFTRLRRGKKDLEEQQLKPTEEQQTTTTRDAAPCIAEETLVPVPQAAAAALAEAPVLSQEIEQTPAPEALPVQQTKDDQEATREDKPFALPDANVREARDEMMSPPEEPCAEAAPEVQEVVPAAELVSPEQDDQLQAEQDRKLKSAIEALLFIAGNPLSLDRLKGIFEDATREQIAAQIELLQQEYDERGSGIMLAEVAGGFQLGTRPENAPWIRKFRSVKVSSKLSRPALETLAIVAYKQPITRTEVEAVRGVNIGGIMRNLMERRLVKIVGKKDVPGKPMMYGTTQDFLQYFGLKDLSALPTLKEFQELEAGEDIMQDAALNDATATSAEDEAFLEAAAAEAAKEENVSG
jgi:segregation and condensation protein B